MYQILIKCCKCGNNNSYMTDLNSEQEIKCDRCNTIHSIIKPVKGAIYILSNPCMPGIVKIGFTSRNIEERIKELNSASGVPTLFEVEATFATCFPQKDEKIIHEQLNCERVNSEREFFRLDPNDAIEQISILLGYGPNYLKQDLKIKVKEEDKREYREKLKLVGIYLVDPGVGVANYVLDCMECKTRFYSKAPKTIWSLCPNCFSKNVG